MWLKKREIKSTFLEILVGTDGRHLKLSSLNVAAVPILLYRLCHILYTVNLNLNFSWLHIN